MRRVLCIWLPQWPLQRLARAAALESVSADRCALETLAEWCQRFSPMVAIENADLPECLFLDPSGAHLFGGEEALAQQVWRECAEQGWVARVAVADTPGMAWAVAHGFDSETAPAAVRVLEAGTAPEMLARMPLAALRLPEEMHRGLHALGLRLTRDLLALPRSELAARFGAGLTQRLEQALGQREELLPPHRPVPLIEVRYRFDSPSEQRATVQAVALELLQTVAQRLRERHEGVRRLICRLDLSDGGVHELCMGLCRPCNSALHLGELLQLQFERLNTVPQADQQAVAGMRLEVAIAEPLRSQQRELFPDPERQDDSAVLGLLERLANRLGHEAVTQPRRLADAQPERACRFVPWLEIEKHKRSARRAEKRPSTVSACRRPLRVWPRPLPIDVLAVAPEGPPIRFRFGAQEHFLVSHWGPERIETGWWRGRSVRRDYYQVETTTGLRLWCFRCHRDGRWFWHGAFD